MEQECGKMDKNTEINNLENWIKILKLITGYVHMEIEEKKNIYVLLNLK